MTFYETGMVSEKKGRGGGGTNERKLKDDFSRFFIAREGANSESE